MKPTLIILFFSLWIACLCKANLGQAMPEVSLPMHQPDSTSQADLPTRSGPPSSSSSSTKNTNQTTSLQSNPMFSQSQPSGQNPLYHPNSEPRKAGTFRAQSSKQEKD